MQQTTITFNMQMTLHWSLTLKQFHIPLNTVLGESGMKRSLTHNSKKSFCAFFSRSKNPSSCNVVGKRRREFLQGRKHKFISEAFSPFFSSFLFPLIFPFFSIRREGAPQIQPEGLWAAVWAPPAGFERTLVYLKSESWIRCDFVPNSTRKFF